MEHVVTGALLHYAILAHGATLKCPVADLRRPKVSRFKMLSASQLLKTRDGLAVTNFGHFTCCFSSTDVMPDWSQSLAFLLKYGFRNTCDSRCCHYLVECIKLFLNF
jgi:hypothetical protein